MRFPLYIVIAIIGLAAAAPARAHDWYPIECCSGFDCDEISESRVKAGQNGYVVDEWFFVPYSKVKASPDGKYHACFPTPDNLRCLFVPPMGF